MLTMRLSPIAFTAQYGQLLASIKRHRIVMAWPKHRRHRDIAVYREFGLTLLNRATEGHKLKRRGTDRYFRLRGGSSCPFPAERGI